MGGIFVEKKNPTRPDWVGVDAIGVWGTQGSFDTNQDQGLGGTGAGVAFG